MKILVLENNHELRNRLGAAIGKLHGHFFEFYCPGESATEADKFSVLLAKEQPEVIVLEVTTDIDPMLEHLADYNLGRRQKGLFQVSVWLIHTDSLGTAPCQANLASVKLFLNRFTPAVAQGLLEAEIALRQVPATSV